jgi:hypothetical protein
MGALAVIDIQERDGHARQRHEVQHWPVSIGRALDNDIVLDDPHVASRHLDLSEENGQIRFTVGNTRNGARINGNDYASGDSGIWPGQHELRLGHSILRLRTARDPLPDEVPFLAPRVASGITGSLLLGLAYYFLLGLDRWLDFSGEAAFWRVLAPLFIGFTFILAFWVAGWSLVSKLFNKQLQAGQHLHVALVMLILMFVLDELVKIMAFSFNWPWLDTHASLVFFIGLGALVFAHMRLISSQRLPQMAVMVSLLTVAGMAAYQIAQSARTGHAADKHSLTSLYPPAFRVSEGVNTEAFISQAGALKAKLDAEAADPADEDREYPE